MDVRKQLMAEHSRAGCQRIVRYVGNSDKRMKELMEIFFAGEYRLTQRAAWPLSYIAIDHPKLIIPYLKNMIDLLRRNVHDAVTRNILRFLQVMEVPKTHHGQLMSTCFDFISDPRTPAAIKAFSLTILSKLSDVYPEIRQELRTIIQERWNSESAAFRARAKRILKKL